MTKKEVQAAIDAHPGEELYVQSEALAKVGRTSDPVTIGFFEPISKTRILKAAKAIAKVEFGTYISFRPDLDPVRYGDMTQPIVLFTAMKPEDI
jgi:hypothetical protein